MSKFGLEYREETGYDVEVYCEDNEWYFHQHYVEWLEAKVEALSQHDVILSLPNKCTCWGGNIDCFSGNCTVCGNRKGNGI